MNQRSSYVNNILIDTIYNSSTFICGDTGRIRAKSNVFALHREVPVFIEDEGNFSDYKVFSEKIPTIPLDENIEQEVLNLGSRIKVGQIKVNAISSSGSFQVGSNHRLDLESRIINIRQFVDAPLFLKRYKGVIVIPEPPVK